ncbi:hypothetical protein [Opitutus terrae]|uniref:Uncharacterized protein n=1 Tax=Opitutus terrae (strain DSM 11246 / JCM 15787 / PB90-1) TaxID=452637 RepID=B1ZYF7_OPITP|nr:hypothetical protein [Opitutus terrae]ACB77055.1 hypothetical protein Oter_3780 [Opitutus terrae PB90-1]
MTNNEAKFLLQAYRAGGLDASDPALAEALAQAKNDPALAAWFAREQAHATAIAAKLREIQPPAGLREMILAGVHADVQRQTQTQRRYKRLWWGLAASLALLLSLAAWWRLTPIRGETLDQFAVNFVSHGFMLQERSPDVAHLKAWLAARETPLPEKLPAEFARLRALGCRTLKFEGQDVSLICFERGGHEYHVFVAHRADFAAPPSAVPRPLRERRGHVFTSWSDAHNDYVLVSDASMDEVRQLL